MVESPDINNARMHFEQGLIDIPKMASEDQFYLGLDDVENALLSGNPQEARLARNLAITYSAHALEIASRHLGQQGQPFDSTMSSIYRLMSDLSKRKLGIDFNFQEISNAMFNMSIETGLHVRVETVEKIELSDYLNLAVTRLLKERDKQ